MRVNPPLATLCTALVLLAPHAARATDGPDAVLEWNAIMNGAALTAATAPLVTTRVTALVESAVFDAVNGIERRYNPIHVRPDAPPRASERAAAVQAAYAMLMKIYPAQAGTLTPRRDASIAAIATGPDADRGDRIDQGITWGQAVADGIWAWRQTDGFDPPPPPFLGAPVIGVWRPTPPLLLSGAGTQFASMTPWVMLRPSQFRSPAPPALASPEYAADYNETKLWGSATGSPRSTDQTELVLFWAGNTALYWNRIVSQILGARHLTLAETAHLIAQLNVAIADAAIACFDAKYRNVSWRPITAIRAGDLDGNDNTMVDTAWAPLLVNTPNHPENPSAHSTLSGAAAFVLESAFGDDTSFTIDSELRPGTRYFPSFSAAVAEIADARVFGGIHFRTACVFGNGLGRAVAEYVLTHAMLERGEGREDDQR
jgi:hypothetical protein